MHRLRNSRHSGFTLIELLLAMSFVAVLLLLILTATLQITRVYNKGITLKQVNQAGAVIGSELQTSLKAADAPLSPDSLSAVGRGRLCLGSYSYVWNYKGAMTNKYSGGDAGTQIGLVKVSDTTSAMCKGSPAVNKANATELLRSGVAGVQLQVRDFSVEQRANSGINYIYRVSYTLSVDDTDNSLIVSSAGREACKGGSDDEFCALNSFTFDVFMRTGGSGRVQ